MMPGTLLLGNAGDCFTCGPLRIVLVHPGILREGAGRCRCRQVAFRNAALCATRAGTFGRADPAAFEELGIQVLARSIQMEHGIVPRPTDAEPSSLARATRVLRMIDSDPEVPHDLNSLAQIARLCPYHFLRVFEGLTGTTPHQYLLRARLRRAAIQLR
jgi:hypothetical protein